MSSSDSFYRIAIKSKALSDIEAIHLYIAQDSPQNADAVAARIVNAFESLDRFPTRFKVHEHRVNPALRVYSMQLNPYVIYYRVDERTHVVDVLTIRHGARRQPKRFR